MLHCIISMVDKTKRALAVLQERGQRDRDELAYWMRRQAEGLDSDMKKRTSEMMASTLRQTEDRVTEVKRRAGVYNYYALYISWFLDEKELTLIMLQKKQYKKLSARQWPSCKRQ